MNSTTVNQYQEVRRKTWRRLSRFHYPSTEFGYDLVNRIPTHLIVQLHRTFREEGYTEFTGLITTTRIETPMLAKIEANVSDDYSVFQLLSHQTQYIGALHRDLRLLWSESPDGFALQDALNSDARYLTDNWSTRHGPWLMAGRDAYQFIYDPEVFRISIEPHDEVWTDPAKYPYKVGNTSELLMLLCALTQTPIGTYNMDTVRHSYSLSKLFLAVLDRTLTIDNIRVNTNDPEEWDYLNPEADVEFGKHTIT